VCVGLDAHKATIAVVVAEPGRSGEVRFHGEIPNRPEAVRRLTERLAGRHGELDVVHEAGPCGYGLHRQIAGLGHRCTVVAPSLVPVRAGERVKTNRRDAVTLARLRRAGELTAVWVPDPTHEGMCDLIRARTAAMEAVRRARQQLQGFLLRHGHVFGGRKAWSPAHRRWLAGLRFAHPAQQVVLQEQIDAIAEAERRRDRRGEQIRELVLDRSMAPVVTALQAMRGIAFLSAVVLVAEVGDFRRFANPRQRMAWLGLVPSERSSGAKVERGGITIGLCPISRRDVGTANRAGNSRARRMLVEGAWSYRFPARVTGLLQARLDDVPEGVRAIAWKAQLRLCARFRRLVAARQKREPGHQRGGPRDGGLRLGDRMPGPAPRCRRLSRSSTGTVSKENGRIHA
jgi:transposase